MDEMEKLDEVMNNKRSFDSILTRIHVRTNYWQQPFTNKGFINLTEEESLRDGPEVVFTFGRKNLWDWYLRLCLGYSKDEVILL